MVIFMLHFLRKNLHLMPFVCLVGSKNRKFIRERKKIELFLSLNKSIFCFYLIFARKINFLKQMSEKKVCWTFHKNLPFEAVNVGHTPTHNKQETSILSMSPLHRITPSYTHPHVEWKPTYTVGLCRRTNWNVQRWWKTCSYTNRERKNENWVRKKR